MNEVIRCQKGWEKLYLPVIKAIIEHDKNVKTIDEKIGIHDVYSENGFLRFVVGNKFNMPCGISTMMDNASIESLKVCEICGATEHVGYIFSPNIVTCCEKCSKEFIEKDSHCRWYDRQAN